MPYRRISAIGAILTLAVTCLSGLSSAEIAYPLGSDYFGFDYDLIFRQSVIRRDIFLLPSVAPYFLDEARDLVSPDVPASFRMLDIDSLSDKRTISTRSRAYDRLRLFNVSAERVRLARRGRGNELPSMVGGFAYRPGRNFGALAFFALDRARAIDPDYSGKKYRGLAGDIETAAIFYKCNKISITLGRTRVFWGPQRVNLSLSETADPLDLISATFTTRHLAFNFIFARLDGSRPDGADSLRFPDRTFQDNRYLVGHRLDLTLDHRFRIGFFETVLYGGEGRPPELYYLNPLQFFHGAQLNENQDDNTIVGMDVIILPGAGTSLYGQLIIDDFQIDDTSPGDREPNEIGFMTGAMMAGRTSSFIPDVRVEYVRLTNRTYHQRDPRNRYLYRNKPVGHPLGPDADSVSVVIRFRPAASFLVDIEAAYRRTGEGSLDKPWDEPWMLSSGDYNEPFPTGVVERAALAAVRFRGYVPFTRYTRNHLFLSFSAGWGELHNFLNIENRTETVSWLDLRLSWMGFTDITVE